MYVFAITFAEHTVHLTNPYFIADNLTVTTITDAVGRGIDVKVILPSLSDSPLAIYVGRYIIPTS